jgi:hypothetical protein
MDKFKISLVVNIILAGFVVMLFMGRGSIKDQALEMVAKKETDRLAIAEHLQNRLALFAIVDSIYKMPASERTRANIKVYAEAQKLPRCEGKPCDPASDKAKITTSLSNTPGASNITISGGGYVVVVNFTDKKGDKPGVFQSINVNSLLGKSVDDAAPEEAEAAE